MRKILIICAIIATCMGIFNWTFLFKARKVSKVILCVDSVQYEIPNEIGRLWISDLNYSILYFDTPSCGFDESFSVEFLDDREAVVSKLLIAQDGCGIFNVANTNRYIEGKDEVRKQIDDYISITRCK